MADNPERVPTNPLDKSNDPDRYDPDRGTDRSGVAEPLDPSGYGGTGEGQTLPGLLGDGAQEERREPQTWLLGLAMVLGFLLFVTLLVHLGH